MKNKIIYSLIFLFSIIVLVLFFNLNIFENTTLTVNKNLKVSDSPFYKKYYSQDKLTVVNIWATWCKPCMEEIPDLNNLKEEFKNNEINFVSFSIDHMNDLEKLKTFIYSKKFQWKDITLENWDYKKTIENLFYNNSSNFSFISINSMDIPRTLIIKNKTVIKEYNGSIDYNEISGFLRDELKKK